MLNSMFIVWCLEVQSFSCTLIWEEFISDKNMAKFFFTSEKNRNLALRLVWQEMPFYRIITHLNCK